MPEIIFKIELPDNTTMDCYSPSSVVRSYFASGEQMSVTEFLARSRRAFVEASERVRAKFGFACSSAAAQLDTIEKTMRPFPSNSSIRILEI
jgi:uncharacterized repeat protein (TIGR04042 family)